MANLIRLQPRAKIEVQGLFASHSGDVYVLIHGSEDKAFTFWEVFAAAPTEANFNALPIASRLTNTADGVIKVKTGATTWADITMS
jgi:hypothetical protein